MVASEPEERSCSVVCDDSGYFCVACQMAAGCIGCCSGGYCLLLPFGSILEPDIIHRVHCYTVMAHWDTIAQIHC